MLDKRTNILFSQETWEMLAALAQQKKASVSELIRRAVKKTYFSEGERMAQKEAYEAIISLRKKVKGKINYKELIDHGRRF